MKSHLNKQQLSEDILEEWLEAGSKISYSDGIRKREEYWSKCIERHREDEKKVGTKIAFIFGLLL
jgi:hypothetical protein